MNFRVSHEEWHRVPVAAAPQVITCAHCILREWEHERISSPYWRWYCNDRPGAWMLIDKTRIPVIPGQVLLIPPHTSFGTECDGPVGHLFMHFALALDQAVPPGRIFSRKPTDSERRSIARLVVELGKDGSSLKVSFLAQVLVNTALAAVPEDYWDGRAPDPRIDEALRRLRHGVEETNASLAKAAGMNVNAFIRKFRQATGHSPHNYRLRLRVEQTCGWLRGTDMTIDDIAAKAGFCDRYHFSRVFKKIMDTTPVEFRRRMVSV